MAKISPFLIKASEESSTVMSKSESNLSTKGNEDVIEQLRVLSEAINNMKPSAEEISSNDHLLLTTSQNVSILVNKLNFERIL